MLDLFIVLLTLWTSLGLLTQIFRYLLRYMLCHMYNITFNVGGIDLFNIVTQIVFTELSLLDIIVAGVIKLFLFNFLCFFVYFFCFFFR
jgi:hypothetical protein